MGSDETGGLPVPSVKSEAEREEIKLGAAYLNGIAIGLFLVGGLSLPTSIVLNLRDGGTWLAVAVFAFCFLASPALHWIARRSLRRLDQ